MTILLFSFSHFRLCAQALNHITISVSGIEYDDPGFALLKESLQKNKKVSSLKTSYDQQIGMLTFSYQTSVADLWNELPKTTRDFFRVNSMNDSRIDIASRNAADQNAETKPASGGTATGNVNADDCKNCYWDICHYDVVKSFEGKLYKGINKDNGTFYYNCEGGIVVQKVIMVNGYGVTTRIQTDTLLYGNATVGTKWGVYNNSGDNNILGTLSGIDLSYRNGGNYTLIARNITTSTGGKTYTDVIVINSRGYSKTPIFGNSNYSFNNYYAKGAGLIRTDTLNFDSDPFSAINKTSDVNAIYTGNTVIKNGIDPSIVGLWKFRDIKNNKDSYYKFNADGTFDFYSGSVSEANKYQGVNHWKMEEGGYKYGESVIDLTWSTGKGFVVRYELEKKNDPETKKPALLMQGAMLVSADNKQPW